MCAAVLALTWRLRRGVAGVWATLGGAAMVVCASIYAVFIAVDGIALEIVVDRWAEAGPEEQELLYARQRVATVPDELRNGRLVFPAVDRRADEDRVEVIDREVRRNRLDVRRRRVVAALDEYVDDSGPDSFGLSFTGAVAREKREHVKLPVVVHPRGG